MTPSERSAAHPAKSIGYAISHSLALDGLNDQRLLLCGLAHASTQVCQCLRSLSLERGPLVLNELAGLNVASLTRRDNALHFRGWLNGLRLFKASGQGQNGDKQNSFFHSPSMHGFYLAAQGAAS